MFTITSKRLVCRRLIALVTASFFFLNVFTADVLALAPELRTKPFSEATKIEFELVTKMMSAAGEIRRLIEEDNARENPMIRLNLNERYFPNGEVEIDNVIHPGSFKCSDRAYNYAIFHFKKENKTIRAIFIRDYDKLGDKDKLTDDELAELGVKTADDRKHFFESREHPALKGVWFIKLRNNEGQADGMPLAQFLQGLNIPFELIKVKPRGTEVQDAFESLREVVPDITLSTILKTLVFKDARGKLHVFILPGDKYLDMQRAGQLMGTGSRMAEDVESVMGYPSGQVSPVMQPAIRLNDHREWPTVRFDSSFQGLLNSPGMFFMPSGVPEYKIGIRLKDLARVIRLRCGVGPFYAKISSSQKPAELEIRAASKSKLRSLALSDLLAQAKNLKELIFDLDGTLRSLVYPNKVEPEIMGLLAQFLRQGIRITIVTHNDYQNAVYPNLVTPLLSRQAPLNLLTVYAQDAVDSRMIQVTFESSGASKFDGFSIFDSDKRQIMERHFRQMYSDGRVPPAAIFADQFFKEGNDAVILPLLELYPDLWAIDVSSQLETIPGTIRVGGEEKGTLDVLRCLAASCDKGAAKAPKDTSRQSSSGERQAQSTSVAEEEFRRQQERIFRDGGDGPETAKSGSSFTPAEKSIYEMAQKVKGLKVGFDLEGTLTCAYPNLYSGVTLDWKDEQTRQLVARPGARALILGLMQNNEIAIVTSASKSTADQLISASDFLKSHIDSGKIKVYYSTDVVQSLIEKSYPLRVAMDKERGIEPLQRSEMLLDQRLKVPSFFGLDVLVDDHSRTIAELHEKILHQKPPPGSLIHLRSYLMRWNDEAHRWLTGVVPKGRELTTDHYDRSTFDTDVPDLADAVSHLAELAIVLERKTEEAVKKFAVSYRETIGAIRAELQHSQPNYKLIDKLVGDIDAPLWECLRDIPKDTKDTIVDIMRTDLVTISYIIAGNLVPDRNEYRNEIAKRLDIVDDNLRKLEILTSAGKLLEVNKGWVGSGKLDISRIIKAEAGSAEPVAPALEVVISEEALSIWNGQVEPVWNRTVNAAVVNEILEYGDHLCVEKGIKRGEHGGPNSPYVKALGILHRAILNAVKYNHPDAWKVSEGLIDKYFVPPAPVKGATGTLISATRTTPEEEARVKAEKESMSNLALLIHIQADIAWLETALYRETRGVSTLPNIFLDAFIHFSGIAEHFNNAKYMNAAINVRQLMGEDEQPTLKSRLAGRGVFSAEESNKLTLSVVPDGAAEQDIAVIGMHITIRKSVYLGLILKDNSEELVAKIVTAAVKTEADRIHTENMKRENIPAIAPQTMLCHIITDSILPSDQRNMLKVSVDQAMDKANKHIERIASLSGENAADPDKYIEDLRALMDRKRGEYAKLGYTNVRFTVACPDVRLVDKVLGSGLSIKALAFKPCDSLQYNVVQVEGIMLALRALDLGDLGKLKSIYELLAKHALSGDDVVIADLNTFIRKVAFELPAAKMEDYELKRTYHTIAHYIWQAA